MTKEVNEGSKSRSDGIELLMTKVRAARVLDAARRLVQNDRYGIAELVLREYPSDGPDAAEVNDIRGQALLSLGLRSQAASCFESALKIDPSYATASEHLDAVKSIADDDTAASEPRYLIIREWMAGFWSDVDHVLGACLTAEAAGRIPIVHWGPQSLYYSSGYNAWTRFFEPISEATLDDARRANNSYYPPKWNSENLDGMIDDRGGPHDIAVALECLGRRESVIVSDYHLSLSEILPYLPPEHPARGLSVSDVRRMIAARYLRPVPEILDRVKEFAGRHFSATPMLGVHFRALDKFQEAPDLSMINARYPELIAGILEREPNLRIFLLTDSDSFSKWCREAYGERVITTSARRSDGDVGLHFSARRHDRSELGAEVLIDTLLATGCERFIGAACSNVSLFVRDLKQWPAGTCELLGDAFNDRPNIHLKLNSLRPPQVER